MKKFIALLLTLVLMGTSAIALSSCGDNNEDLLSQIEAIETTEPFKEIEWPDSDIAKLIPKPESTFGRIEWESSDGFSITLGKITESKYKDYVKACKDKGFKEDYEKGDDYYRAENKEKYYLSLEYEKGNIMSVRLESPSDDEDDLDDEDEETSSKSKTSSKAKTSSKEKSSKAKSGVSADFKKTMDEYESFMNDYVAFMKKYKKSDNSLELLDDYTDMMSKYTDFAKEIEDIDEDSLSTDDYAYYVEVTGRVAKILAEIGE